MIEELEARVEKVVIRAIQDGTYFASVYLRDVHEEVLEFDARASDSLALSLRSGCPIFIADEVFKTAAIESPFADEDEFQEFVEDNLDLREFRKRNRLYHKRAE